MTNKVAERTNVLTESENKSFVHAIVNAVSKGYADKTVLEDILDLSEGRAIFPEFLQHDKHVIMLPGYTELCDVSRNDGCVKKLNVDFTFAEVARMTTYLELLQKVFDVQDPRIEFGIVHEIA